MTEFLPDHLAVGQHVDTGLWHGMYYRNRPTPSGCDRFTLEASTTEGYNTSNEAALAIEKHFPDLAKISEKSCHTFSLGTK